MKNRTYAIAVISAAIFTFIASLGWAGEPARPNFLWITLEDISPNLGCYGDEYARTPNMDELASRGVRYTNAFSTAGVCAPSRSTLITGVYAPSLGTHPMRCQGDLPADVQCFSRYLRDAGYYCTNNVKTDYNFKHPRDSWDESSKDAHYKNRGKDQPFFAIFNLTTCHESQIRLPEAEYQRRMATLEPDDKHDPTKASVPPFHPDTPEVRNDWARYADMITFTDRRVGELLKELKTEGLAEDTIVFVFSDHGAGMPRCKRWLYDSSLRVPFIVHFPAKFQDLAPADAGQSIDRLISLVDVAPTMLSLAGLKPQQHMQGKAFLGPHSGEPREFIVGHRDRMDERTDMIRAVRDKRFKYIRNYYPQRPYFHEQFNSYGFEMPTLRVWQKLSEEGKLDGPAGIFMQHEKPAEELYDTLNDPHEINNLASSPEHRKSLQRLSRELDRWQVQIVDLGLLPEADLRTRFADQPAYDAVRAKPESYPLTRIARAAFLAASSEAKRGVELAKLIDDPDPAVRYWAATGLGRPDLSADGMTIGREALASGLNDPVAWVRVAAAESFCRRHEKATGQPILEEALGDSNPWVRLQAIEAVDRLGLESDVLREKLNSAKSDSNEYVVRVAEHAQPPRATRPMRRPKTKNQ